MCLPAVHGSGRRGSAVPARRMGARVLALRDRLLRGGDLVERAAEMHSARARDLRRAPGDRTVEGPVELEDTRAVAEAPKACGIAVWQAVAGQLEHLARGHVEQGRGRACELVERLHPSPRLDLAADRTQVRGERVGQALRAAAGDGPADPVRAQRQHDSEGCAGRGPQREHRMGAAPAQQGARSLALEAPTAPVRSPIAARLRRSAPVPADDGAGAAGRGSRAGAGRHCGRADRTAGGRPAHPDRVPAPSPPRSAPGPPPCRRREGAPAAHRGAPARGRAGPVAGCPGRAKRARGNARWSRCRARSREVSAPPSGSRRPRSPSPRQG